ncbi:MAG TPA: hypothetical protein VKP61_08815 [Candidatus Acidoferrum sp.]|nr:hypothetical protein [Candidatus Acidoferrum sp.]
MNLSLSAAYGLVAVAAAYALYKLLNPTSAFAASGDAGSGGTGEFSAGSGGSDAAKPAPSGVASQYDPLILNAAHEAQIDPVLLKAVCATETGFRVDAINPEKDFTLNGVTYAQYDSEGQALLVQWIKDGNDPASIGLNPSCGIAQVRVGNAKKFIQGLDAWDLFDPKVCLEAAAFLISSDGTTVETADKYNVGAGLNWFRGVRNAAYQQKVADFYSRFAGDF